MPVDVRAEVRSAEQSLRNAGDAIERRAHLVTRPRQEFGSRCDRTFQRRIDELQFAIGDLREVASPKRNHQSNDRENKGGEEGQGQPQSKFRPLVSEPLTLRRLGQLEFRNLQVLLGEIELRRSELRAGGRL